MKIHTTSIITTLLPITSSAWMMTTMMMMMPLTFTPTTTAMAAASSSQQHQEQHQEQHLRRMAAVEEDQAAAAATTTSSPPAKCSLETCLSYDSYADLVSDMEDIIIMGGSDDGGGGKTTTVCICPYDYSPDNVSFGSVANVPYGGIDTCRRLTRHSEGSGGVGDIGDDGTSIIGDGNVTSTTRTTTTTTNTNTTTDGDDDEQQLALLTITVPSNVQLELICVEFMTCYFGCPDQTFHVEGTLQLTNFSLGGGIKYEESNSSRIEVTSTGNLVLQGGYIQMTQTNGRGGAIANNGGSVTIRDSMFAWVSAAQEGGAIYSSGELEIYDTMILSSTSEVAGGGLFLDTGSSTTLDNVRFNYNESPPNTNPDIHVTTQNFDLTTDDISIDGCAELVSATGEPKSTELTTFRGDVIAVIEPCKNQGGSSGGAGKSMTTFLSLGMMIVASLLL